MVDPTLPLPGLSPIAEKAIVARFDGGRLSSDGGLLVLRQIERRVSVTDRLAACIDDPRDPASTVHTLADIIRFRLLMIAAGYEDANDATGLRLDPLFKMALERLPSERDLCSQSTISRLENLPDARTLLRLGRALVDLYCTSFRQVPRRMSSISTTPSTRSTAASNCGCSMPDDYGFQPIVVFDQDGRFVTAVLRPAKRPKGVEIRAFLRRLVGAIRTTWPQVEILLRADSHYACPEVLDWCEANGLDYILGLAPTSTLKRHVGGLEASTSARFKADPTAGKVRRFKEFHDAAGSWSRVRRIVARVEAGGDGTDTRFIVTNLGHGNGRSLYQDLYCRRGQAENHNGAGVLPSTNSTEGHLTALSGRSVIVDRIRREPSCRLSMTSIGRCPDSLR